MKKALGLVVVLVAVAAVLAYRFRPAPVAIVAAPATQPSPLPSPVPLQAPLTPPPSTLPTITFTPDPTPAKASATAYPQMNLEQFLGPNNRYFDPIFGVSATYPEGWTVRQGMRWGPDNRQSTIFFTPPEGNHAVPSMYYQNYPEGAPPANAEAALRDVAAYKEKSRSEGGVPDYKNDPDSFVFREINGHPTLSYFATYTIGDQVQAEYFMRILGPEGYVMFFVKGTATDLKALIPAVNQMGDTVTPP